MSRSDGAQCVVVVARAVVIDAAEDRVVQTAVQMTRVEFLAFPPSAKYAAAKAPDLPAQLFARLCATAPSEIRPRMTTRYEGQSDWLVLYGPGGVDRREPMRQQLARGGHVICWDAPYWQRGQYLRVSIDHAHPQHWVMRRERTNARYQQILTVQPGDMVFDPSGRTSPLPPLPAVRQGESPLTPLIAGIGAKSRAQYGAEIVRAWESQMVVQCRLLFPDRPVCYRPKPHHEDELPGTVRLTTSEELSVALRRARVVITWHSNVAVDALWWGRPVVCRDGAAAAICPSTLTADPQPIDYEVRRQFLYNLAWFQWMPSEAPQIWRFLKELLL